MSSPLHETLPRWAAVLGYAGLIPFLALASATWLANPTSTFRMQAAFSLLAYGATIASFLGAIHWGLAMRGPLAPRPVQWVWGVFPSLVAWVALLLPLSQGLITLTLLLGICLAVDWRSYPDYGLEKWLVMRLHLTVVAGACLIAGSVAL